MEWTQKYSSFNSWKGLTYYQNYIQILDWMNGAKSLPPPVEVNLDPVAECNLRCYFCITQRYLRDNRDEVGEMRVLPTDYMLRLVDFLADWGVRGLCISGGGEPTLHTDLLQVIEYASERMDVALVTNATNLQGDILPLLRCRWVALSVDAADANTYRIVKGKNYFQKVISNIAHVTALRTETGSKVDFCFKFLVLPDNQHQIYEACKLAKSLGVQDFHARPVDFERPDVGGRKLELNIASILAQFEKCHTLENENFHVYTVTHKFSPQFHVKHDFEECLASPILLPILQDGNAYVCVEKKMERDFRLGSCYPDPEKIMDWWGGDEHRELVRAVDITQCSRCVIGQYNQQMGNLDKMCLSFP